MLNQDLIQIAIVLNLLTLAAFVALVFLFYKRERKLLKQQERLENKRSSLLSEVEQESERILSGAVDKAGELILESEELSSESKNNLEGVLRQGLKEVMRLYQQEVRRMVEEMRIVTKDSMEQLKQSMLELQSQSKQELSASLDKQYKQAEQQVEAYKQQKMQQLDAQIDGLVQKVIKDVLPEAITTESHTKIVLEQLEKAKKELLGENK